MYCKFLICDTISSKSFNLIGTFCIVNVINEISPLESFVDLIGTFCIVNENKIIHSQVYFQNLIGTFCIVNVP